MEIPVEYPDLATVRAVLKLRGFKVSRNRVPKSPPTAFGRRHYYMIILSIGESKVHYDDRVLHLDGVYLLLANSQVPYSTEIVSENQTGYSCVFTENFIQPVARLESLQQSPLFKVDAPPAFKLDAQLYPADSARSTAHAARRAFHAIQKRLDAHHCAVYGNA